MPIPYKWTNKQQNRLTNMKNKLVVVRGGGVGRWMKSIKGINTYKLPKDEKYSIGNTADYIIMYLSRRAFHNVHNCWITMLHNLNKFNITTTIFQFKIQIEKKKKKCQARGGWTKPRCYAEAGENRKKKKSQWETCGDSSSHIFKYSAKDLGETYENSTLGSNTQRLWFSVCRRAPRNLQGKPDSGLILEGGPCTTPWDTCPIENRMVPSCVEAEEGATGDLLAQWVLSLGEYRDPLSGFLKALNARKY